MEATASFLVLFDTIPTPAMRTRRMFPCSLLLGGSAEFKCESALVAGEPSRTAERDRAKRTV